MTSAERLRAKWFMLKNRTDYTGMLERHYVEHELLKQMGMKRVKQLM